MPFIVNTVLLWLTDKLIASFEIRSMRSLLVSSAIITVVNGIFFFAYTHSVWLDTGHGAAHPRWI